MPILPPLAPSVVKVGPAARHIATTGGSSKVRGWDNTPASGRTVLLLAKNALGQWYVIAETTTDNNGDYSFTIDAGPNDPLVVVGLGSPEHGEYTRALGNLRAVD